MRTPAATWEAEYKHDRRKHRHRCKHCRKIINAGENVLMTRKTRGTVAMHVDCADIFCPSIGITNRELMHIWGREALKDRGWNIPELRTNFHDQPWGN